MASTAPRATRVIRARAALAGLALLTSALLWVPTIEARVRTSGAGDCGQFSQSVAEAVDGNVLIPMFDGGEGRNSEGVLIDKNLTIEGGWAPPSTDCSAPNVDYPKNDPAGFLAAGFSYGGPSTPSRLNYTGDPVVTYASAVKSAQVYDMQFAQGGTGLAGSGGAVRIDGLSGATLRFENIGFIADDSAPSVQQTVDGQGGALYLRVLGGSNVVIDGGSASEFGASSGGALHIEADGASTVTLRNFSISGSRAFSGGGGGLQVVIRGGSTVVLDRVTVSGSQASGNGGGARVEIHSGTLEVRSSQFTGNSSSAGSGGGLAIQRIGSTGAAAARLIDTTISGNSAPTSPNLFASGITVEQLPARIFTPVVGGRAEPGARITAIARSGSTYRASFETAGFTPQDGAAHVHFFFDTVPPTQAGVPGSGPWFMYFGGSPFTGYGIADRPFGARALCILVADAGHAVTQGTGNCVSLP